VSPELPRRRRETARVLVVDDQERVLLFRGGDPGRPEAGTWWFTPGGEIEDGETPAQAGRRELAEETGLVCDDLGPVVMDRRIAHEFDGVVYDQTESYFLLRTPAFDLDVSQWTAVEVATVVEHRWWSAEDLRHTTDRVYPEGLVAFLETTG
jgi:8-oxo-dGTP pyrophosphatase MutT (NUDIX family)